MSAGRTAARAFTAATQSMTEAVLCLTYSLSVDWEHAVSGLLPAKRKLRPEIEVNHRGP
jgi:hypothetical protein